MLQRPLAARSRATLFGIKEFTLNLLASMTVLAGCSPNNRPGPEVFPASHASIAFVTTLPPGQSVVRFAVTGMTCEGCGGGLRSDFNSHYDEALARMAGRRGYIITSWNEI